MRLAPPPTSLKVLFSHLKVVWKHWNVQSMVLASFTVQLFLIFFAPLRKKSSNRVVIGSIWLAYLMADWIAILAIGVISDPCGSLKEAEVGPDTELYAFWGQFLLLHLGGPDTITALAKEDNELWLRTGLHLAVQIYCGLGILVKSVAHSQTSMWLPTLLMFAAGVIKYAERLSSLFHGRLAKICSQTISKFFVNTDKALKRKNRSDAELVRVAAYNFYSFKMLYVRGLSGDVKWINKYMIDASPEETFKMMEIEFNLTYEAFYTKAALLCLNWRWKILRLAVTLLEVGCLVVWLFFTDKHGFKEYNILITYTLLIGAIAVDVFGFLMIHMLSQWSICLKANNWDYDGSYIHDMVFWCRKRTWGGYMRPEDAPFWALFRRALFRQWSETIPQLSFLSLCLQEKSNMLQGLMGLEEGMDQSKYVSSKWFSNNLRDFLHQDLKKKRKSMGALENIGKSKGGWACRCLISNYETGMIEIPLICQLVENNKDLFKVLLWWHIITELCYQGEHFNLDSDVAILSTGNEPKNLNATNTDGNTDNKINCREICKTLSDYLMYLVIHRRDTLSVSHTVDNRLWRAFLAMGSHLRHIRHNIRESFYQAALIMFDSYKLSDGDNEYLKDVPTLDILRELEELEKKQIDKWHFMAELWSELLYYAAINCDPNVHLTNVKQGGELLSFVWLLLAHLGFGLPENDSEKAWLHLSGTEDCEEPEHSDSDEY